MEIVFDMIHIVLQGVVVNATVRLKMMPQSPNRPFSIS